MRRLFQAGVAAALVVGCGFTCVRAVSAQTPRLSDGKPDLSGLWARLERNDEGFTQKADESGNLVRLFPSRRCAPNQVGCRENTNQNNDYEFTGRIDTNRPVYKPEYWDRVQFLDYDTNFSDPMFRCQPLGVPRVGPPTKIIQTANEVIFLYSGRDHDYRIIPTDGRGHDSDAFPAYFGDSVGRWEGDTLVIDVVSRNDTTWLAGTGGFFHTYDLHVVERLRRDGDTLTYDVTVEDPNVLLQPWVLKTRQLKLNANPKATIAEGLPCRDYDAEITVSRIRH
jgi:hypothetical protein